MSITDELRESVTKKCGHLLGAKCDGYYELLAIADRIDAECEEAIQQALMGEGSVPATDENMAEHGWVRLPLDADGEPIRMGDVMEWVRYKDDDPTIVRTVSGIGNCVFFAWSDEQGRYAQYEAHAYRHYHAPTVEDVLLDACKAYHSLMVESMSDVAHDMPAPSEVIAKYAKRLTLAEEEDA